jgi:LysR family transcriptional regulator, transcriptional activator of the cysJI operon
MEFLKLNLNQLMVFFQVANEKSMSLAAEKLCLTQPTVSSHIKSLEESLRVKLIEINRKKITLTSNGETLYRYCKEIYNQALLAQRFLEITTGTTINVGVSPIFVSAISRTVRALSDQKDSAVKVNLNFGGASVLARNVIDSKLDLAIVPHADYGNDELSYVRISDDEKLIFFASANHLLFQKEKIEWKDLCLYPLIMGQDTYIIQKLLTDKLTREGVHQPLKFKTTANNLECCKILLKDEESLSISLIEDIQNEIQSGQFKIVHLPEDFRIKVDAILLRGLTISPIIQRFINCARSSFHDASLPIEDVSKS